MPGPGGGWERDLTVEFIESASNAPLGLDSVDEGVLIVLHINHTHVVFIIPA